MNIINFLIILLAITLNAFSQIALKLGVGKIGKISLSSNFLTLVKLFISLPILTGLILYILSFGIWIVVLSRVNVSIAYPMLSIGYIFVTFLAWVIFNEPISAFKILSISIIIIGVLMLAKS